MKPPLVLLAFLALAAPAQATPLAVQDERHITCGTPEERQVALSLARELGATRVRVNAVEHWANPPSTRCDPVTAAQATHAYGLEPQVTVVGDTWYARQLAAVLGPIVRTWSVWNEPNLSHWQYGPMAGGNPRTYRRLYNRVAAAIRQSDPGARVLFGELPPVGTDPLKFLRQATAGTTVHTEGLAIHPYPHALNYRRNYGTGKQPFPGQLAQHLKDLRRTLRQLAAQWRLCTPGPRCRPVPVWITEFGGRNIPLAEYWRVAQRQGVRQITHYQLIQGGENWWDTALVGSNGHRRGQWYALQKTFRR